MQSNRKIIFIDVDGTLVDYENRIPDSAIQAVRKARENGHRVYICTGRSKAEIYEEIWKIGFDGMIGGNGSYVEDHYTVVMYQHLSKAQCSDVINWLQKRGLAFYLECNTGLYGSDDFEEEAVPSLQLYAQRKQGQQQKQIQVCDVFPDMIFHADLYREDVNKISFLLHSYQDYIDARAAFPDLQAGTWGGKGELALFGDLGVKHVTKACAIEALLRHLQADQKDTIAFGDAKIDIPMLEYCAIGIAMANGGEEIKAVADEVTKAVDEDGLYYAFVKHQLI